LPQLEQVAVNISREPPPRLPPVSYPPPLL
jgi:hypothetical protein